MFPQIWHYLKKGKGLSLAGVCADSSISSKEAGKRLLFSGGTNSSISQDKKVLKKAFTGVRILRYFKAETEFLR